MTKYSTIEKIETEVRGFSSHAKLFLFLYLVFLGLSIGLYYVHLKVSGKKTSKLEVPYFISYLNFLNYVVYFVLIFLVYKILESGMLFDLLKKINVDLLKESFGVVEKLPIYNLFLEISYDIFILSLLYLLFSCIVFGVFLFLKKRLQSFSTVGAISENEKNVKDYIERYREKYPRDSIKEALQKTNVPSEDIELWLQKYYDDAF